MKTSPNAPMEAMAHLTLLEADPALAGLRARFEDHLAAVLPQPLDDADVVVVALREAALSPGKRVRPLLLLGAARSLGCPERAVLDAACALELLHAASLVMDDLPCMDDASLRRGRPTLHRQFGEDVAALAVIALMSQAFRLAAASGPLGAAARARITVTLADAVGCRGLVGGQLRDLRSAHGTAEDAASVNGCKTGALFRAALEIAALAAGAGEAMRERLGCCGDEIGQAFQLLDDLKDSGELAPTGKDLHQDAGKTTLLSLLGHEPARRRLQAHLRRVEGLLREAFPQDDLVLRLLRQACGFQAIGPPTPQSARKAAPSKLTLR